jgi:hypothetical protein
MHGLLLVGLVLWAGMGRFGKPRGDEPRFTDGKRVLIDNSAQLLSLGGHTAESLGSYFEQTLRAVAAHYFLPSDLPPERLVRRLQRLAEHRGVDVDLGALRDRIAVVGAGSSTERAVRLARQLYRFRQEMIDGSARPEQAP